MFSCLTVVSGGALNTKNFLSYSNTLNTRLKVNNNVKNKKIKALEEESIKVNDNNIDEKKLSSNSNEYYIKFMNNAYFI